MGFGGQFGFGDQPSAGEMIYDNMKKSNEERNQREEERMTKNDARYNRLYGQQSAQPSVSDTMSQQPNNSWLNQALTSTPAGMVGKAAYDFFGQQGQPQQQPQQPKIEQPMQQPAIEPAISPASATPMQNVEMPADFQEQAAPKKTSNLQESINQQLNSDDPGVFSNALDSLASIEESELSPGTPAFDMFKKVDAQYGIGVDENGEKMYECPLTKTPCGRKTFWTRLKEFFQTMLGLKSKEDAIKTVSTLNKKDPISKQFSSQQPQVKAQKPTASSAVWSRPQMSGFKGAM